jgi:hypothetical protein
VSCLKRKKCLNPPEKTRKKSITHANILTKVPVKGGAIRSVSSIVARRYVHPESWAPFLISSLEEKFVRISVASREYTFESRDK